MYVKKKERERERRKKGEKDEREEKLHNVWNDRFLPFDTETLVDTSRNRLHSNEPYSSSFSPATIIPSRYYCHGAIARGVTESSTTAVDEWKRIAIDRIYSRLAVNWRCEALPIRAKVSLFPFWRSGKKIKNRRNKKREVQRERRKKKKRNWKWRDARVIFAILGVYSRRKISKRN